MKFKNLIEHIERIDWIELSINTGKKTQYQVCSDSSYSMYYECNVMSWYLYLDPIGDVCLDVRVDLFS